MDDQSDSGHGHDWQQVRLNYWVNPGEVTSIQDVKNSALNALSQQEHPLLGQPFFYLHPCKTEEFMKLVLTAAEDKHRPMNYVLLWLSLVGPAVGLDVPLEYCIEPQPLDPVSGI
uniref:Ubiquitin-like-conjugating enzyme ATG10 n=1 Tax=Nothobranchius rachovii TaxID=451742 RepID=A0A1A8RH74_9TELE